MATTAATREPAQDVFHIQSVQKDWGPIVHYRPAVSSSSRLVATASGRSIKIFSTVSGKLLQEHFHHDCKVVGVQRSSAREDEFVSCDEAGTVCFWSMQTKEAKKFNLSPSSNQKSVVVSFNPFDEDRQLLLLVHKKGFKTGHLFSCAAPYSTKLPTLLSKSVELGVNKASVVVSSKGEHVAFIYRRGLIILTKDSKLGKERVRQIHMVGERPLTCLAFHPNQPVIASGDVTGRIVLWYDICNKRPIRKQLHWHEMPVADLAFSALGNELYSGGSENVLVKWQLSSESHYFLPRLGLPIKFITTDSKNNLVITAHLDNALSIISARDFKKQGTIQGLSMNTESKNSFPAGLTYDPCTRSLILNGRTGHVQFYDPHHSRQLYHLDITMSNYYSQERHQRIQNTEVEHVAMSRDGLRLATAEFRQDLETSVEIRLKFWHFKEEDQSWYLNTSVDLPHQKRINNITFQPTPTPGQLAPLCVSCGDDGKFKIWEEEDASDIYGTKSVWRSTGVGFYRHLPATAVRISPDGSLLAAGFDSILTIWIPQSCQLKGTLSQPYLTEPLQQVEFGNSEGCWSVAITRTHRWVCAWDLFTCTLSWRVSVMSSCMAVDPLSSYMAVFSEAGSVYVFEPHSSELVACQQGTSKSRPTSAAFVPRVKASDSCAVWNEKSSLMYITEDQTLQSVEVMADLNSANDKIAGRVRQLVHHSEASVAPTPFAALIAKTRTALTPEEKVGQVGTASHGVQVEKSSALLQQVLSEARVYHLDSFAALATEFCKMVIPEAVTSEEKQTEIEMDSQLKEKVNSEKKKRKRLMKEKKNDLKKVAESDFSDLLKALAL
ncbi:WD repeat-containing protein 75 [Chionoecetes opilio]|uniref:WD repeat-containing protein 75 n=1 Tax=Chionoecetes opilio TaxID=41210 RepID=A0A8J4XQB0_CHIOP|nr:WD repeat-containing protein 75 [Chionoecetes opilio]